MAQRGKELFTFGLLAGIIALVLYVWFAPGGLQPAPDVTFTTQQGKPIALSSLKGKPVLVNFWATTCPSCIKEMPHLVELYHELHPKGLEIIGVAMQYDPAEQVAKLTKTRNIPYTIALDSSDQLAQAFGRVRLTPTTFLIDPEGQITFKQVGTVDMVAIKQEILNMINQQGA